MAKRLKVGKRELALLFTMDAIEQLEKRLERPIGLSEIKEALIDKLDDRKTLIAVVNELARQGEYEMGFTPDFDESWLMRHLKPGQTTRLQVAVIGAIAEGLNAETTSGDDEEVDVVLEEIKKKREKG